MNVPFYVNVAGYRKPFGLGKMLIHFHFKSAYTQRHNINGKIKFDTVDDAVPSSQSHTFI